MKSSKRAGFAGTRYIQDCKGYYECKNTECPFMTEFSKPNKVHFRPCNSGNEMQCEQCGHIAEKGSCEARKVIEIQPNGETCTVYHFGSHGCPLKKANVHKISKADIEEVYKNDCSKKPSTTGSGMVKRAILTGSTWEDIENLAEGSLDDEFYKNTKKKVLSEMFPHGHNINAVRSLKVKTDEKDRFLIFKVTDETVFKTSNLKLAFLKQMNINGSHTLSRSYLHVDAKADRCKQFTTITGSIMHSLLKQLIPIAIMECPTENRKFLTTFFSQLKEAYREKFGDEEFIPNAVICDEASCNWQALHEIFGEDLVERSKSCDFHFQQSINRAKGKIITDENDKEIFKTLANDLLNSITEQHYEASKDALQMFIGTNEKLFHLTNWLSWWDKRRAHWAKAFRPDHFSPGANLAEVTNARFFHRGSVNLSLVAAAVDDVVDSVILEKRYNKIGENIKVTGSGKGSFEVNETELKRQEVFANTAKRKWNEILEGAGTSGIAASSGIYQHGRSTSRSAAPIHEDRSFEPTLKKIKPSNESQHRPFPFRPKRNAQVSKSILFAKSANLKLLKCQKTEKEVTFHFRNYKDEDIEVIVQQIPNCSCPFKTKNQTKICMHIVYALMRYCKVEESSSMLHQLAYTKNELDQLVENITDISDANTDNSGCTQQTWILSKKNKLPGKTPVCSGCRSKEIVPGDLHIYVKGKIVLKNNIKKDATFRFCPKLECLKNLPKWSDLKTLTNVFVDLKGNVQKRTLRKCHLKE